MNNNDGDNNLIEKWEYDGYVIHIYLNTKGLQKYDHKFVKFLTVTIDEDVVYYGAELSPSELTPKDCVSSNFLESITEKYDSEKIVSSCDALIYNMSHYNFYSIEKCDFETL